MSLRETLQRPVLRVAVPLFLVGGIVTSVVEAYRGYEALESEAANTPAGAVVAGRQPDPVVAVSASPARAPVARAALETSPRAAPSRSHVEGAALPAAYAVPTAPAGLPVTGVPFPPWAAPALPNGNQAVQGSSAPPAWSPSGMPAWSPLDRRVAPRAARRGAASKSCGMGFG
jgi:hypothetical protein